MRPPPSQGEAPVHDPLPVLPAYYASAADRQHVVGRLFDTSAVDYDCVDRVLALGTGSRYRRDALRRAGRMISGAVLGALARVRGRAEALPFAAQSFDFLALGFGLRHLSDLERVFLEFRRVLKPGGRLLVLEITRPSSRVADALLHAYLRGIVPFVARLIGRSPPTPLLYRYYWDTIAACAPPERVIATLAATGFAGATRHIQMGIFSEYCATAT